jgi:hypothetical protein
VSMQNVMCMYACVYIHVHKYVHIHMMFVCMYVRKVLSQVYVCVYVCSRICACRCLESVEKKHLHVISNLCTYERIACEWLASTHTYVALSARFRHITF